MEPETETTEEKWRVTPAFSVKWLERTRYMEQYFSFPSTGQIPGQPKPVQRSRPRWSFDGTFPAGRVAMHDFTDGNVTVMPYQAGLGSLELGEPSYGCVPGNNDFALGVSRRASGTNRRVDIVTRGEVEVELGAAINVGATYYYRKKGGGAITANPVDNPAYEKVAIVPLFEGDSIPAGTELFAGAMGHEITPDPRGMCPYPLTGPHTNFKLSVPAEDPRDVDDARIIPGRSSFDENPWWDFTDQTFRAVGITSTPPEPGQAIAVVDGPGLLGDSIANHGSRIFRKPLEAERAAGIGIARETVRGSGTWPYTGALDLPMEVYATDALTEPGMTWDYHFPSTRTPEGSGYATGPALAYFAWTAAVEINTVFNPTESDEYEIPKGVPGMPQFYTLEPELDVNEFFVGREFWALNARSCVKTGNLSGLIRFVVRSNEDGVVKIGIAPGYIGEPFAYESGRYFISFVGNYEPMNVMVKVDENNEVVSVYPTDTGLGVFDGDIMWIVQPPGLTETGGYGLLVRLGNPSSPIVYRPVSGGASYNMNKTSPLPHLEDNNLCTLVDPDTGVAVPDRFIRLMATTAEGAVTCLSWNLDFENALSGSGPLAFSDYTLYGVYINKVYELHHNTPIDGIESRKVSDTALFRVPGKVVVLLPGAGHVLGEVLGGGIIKVTEVGENGEMIAAEILPDAPPILNRSSFATAKGARVFFKAAMLDTTHTFKQSVEGETRYPGYAQATYMRFTVRVLEGGSGYVAGQIYDCVRPDAKFTSLDANIIVDATDDGRVLSATVAFPGTELFEIGTKFEIGSGGCVVELWYPEDPGRDYMVKGGVGYPATPTGGTTYPLVNLTSNSFLARMNATSGQAILRLMNSVYRYSHLARLEEQDLLRIIIGPRSARNESAVAEVSGIVYTDGIINFNASSLGSGYPDIDDAYCETRLIGPREGQVTIVVDGNGSIRTTSTVLSPTKYKYGDRFSVGSGNGVVMITPRRDVPPTHELEYNGREPTVQQWETYRQVMESATNLVGLKIKAELFPSAPRYTNLSYYNDGDGGTDYNLGSGYGNNCAVM